MIFKKRKIEKLTSNHKDQVAHLKAEYEKELEDKKVLQKTIRRLEKEADVHIDKEITEYKKEQKRGWKLKRKF